MKKTISLIILLLLVLSMSACGAMSKSTPAEDFEYEMSNGEIIITGYKGTEREIYIPSKINDRPVTTIGEDAFKNYDLTHVTIPDSVTTIDKYAFCECKCLVSVDFPKNLELLNNGVFRNCESLKKIDLPESLKEVGDGVFRGCISLEKINFSTSLEKIHDCAFEGCESLADVSLPDNLKYLESNSFAECSKLESLKIPYNTEIRIGVSEYGIDNDIYYVDGKWVYVVSFCSPVGGFTESYPKYSKPKFEELTTKLIISEGSYAYYQIKDKGYEAYGLKYEIK